MINDPETIVLYCWSYAGHPRRYRWPVTMTVAEVAFIAAADFGFQTGSPHLRGPDGRMLDRRKKLQDCRLSSADKISLIVLAEAYQDR